MGWIYFILFYWPGGRGGHAGEEERVESIEGEVQQ